MRYTNMLLPLLISFLYDSVAAQEFDLIPADSKITVLGTSTIHDWEVEAMELEGNAHINEKTGMPLDIRRLRLEVAVEGLESGKDAMNKKMYEALKHKDFPTIIYDLESVETIKKNSDGSFELHTIGSLTIAGESKKILMQVLAAGSTSTLNFQGETTIDIASFSMSPPTAVFGSIKTGKDVTIKFNVNFKMSKKIKS